MNQPFEKMLKLIYRYNFHIYWKSEKMCIIYFVGENVEKTTALKYFCKNCNITQSLRKRYFGKFMKITSTTTLAPTMPLLRI